LIEGFSVERSEDNESTTTKKDSTNPIIILMGILFLAMLMTYGVESGSYEREGRMVIPGSCQRLEKEVSILGLLALPKQHEQGTARLLSFIDTLITVPKGLHKGAGLIFMVLIIGGYVWNNF
jgi:uncharacterized ion transporter superfamily protein YfcC